MEFLTRLFDTTGFPPRWQCGEWTPFLGWLHIVSNVLIFVAYASIPASLAVILIRRRDVPFPWVIRLFVAFILSCGITHLIDAIIFFEPIYRFQGLARAITAVVSLVAAVVLIRALPGLLALRGLRAEHAALTAQVGEMQTSAGQLARERADLETHSANVSQKWRRMVAALEATGGVACHWKVGQNSFDWEVGFAECTQRFGLGSRLHPDWLALLGPAAEELHKMSRDNADAKLPFDFEAPLPDEPGIHLLLRALAEPPVAGQPRTMIGYFRLWHAQSHMHPKRG